MDRKNQGCTSAYADVHLLWLMDTQTPLQNAQDYPLEPDRPALSARECKNDQLGNGPNYYNYIVKRQVTTQKC